MSTSNIANFLAAEPSRYPIIDRLEFCQIGGGGVPWTQVVRILMRSREPDELRRLQLTFTDVTDFRFAPSLHPSSLHGILISSTVDRQWERSRYMISNGEQDTEFRLNCFEFSHEIVIEAP